MNAYAVFVDGKFYWSGRGYRFVLSWARALSGRVEIQRVAPTPEYRALGAMRLVKG